MTKNIIPFWTWNRQVSFRTSTPGRRSSGKTAFNTRVLRSLCGVPFTYEAKRKARLEKAAAKRRRILGL